MTFDIKEHENDFLVIPLGGTGEIGMNVTLFHSNNKWLIMDLGVGFSDDELPGTDLTVPDIGYIAKRRKNVLGIVLTHGHEDHFGAIYYLWELLRCPIYASPFTAALLRAKLASAKMLSDVILINEFNDSDAVIHLDTFKITMVRVTHSIPDAYAALIEAQGFRVFFTGDFKFDHSPVISSPTDTELLKTIGDGGVDLMLCDSTNVFSTNKSGNEGDLLDHLRMIYSKARGIVFTTMFASNIARIQTTATAAKECGRKIILLGGALIRATEAAHAAGYLSSVDNICQIEELERFKRNEIVILCTGCQGEPLATMSKIMGGKYPGITVHSDDTIVFSSVIIPGNEIRVGKIMNQIIKTGAELHSIRNAQVHVSGHPGQPELRKMYEYIRPKITIPIHGETIHLHKHAELAAEWGVEHAVIIKNGDVVRLNEQGVEVIGQVKHGKYAIDGKFFRSPHSEVMQVRRNLMTNGIVFVMALLCANTGRLLKRPVIMAPGLLDSQHDKDITANIISQIERDLFSKANLRPHVVYSVIFSIVKRVCQRRINKYPEIRIHVERV